MAGINRLGKGPAKPGTMRPQDPNKYKTMDIFSEGTEGDKDYARMVQDIEDTQQNHMGWLFSRGAFDKGDLLYLRDEEEKRRFAEQELRDSELRSFARMRHKAEATEDPGTSSTAQQATKESGRSRAAHSLIRMKPVAKVKRKQAADLSSTKRIKTKPQTVQVKTEDGVADVKEEDDGEGGLAGLLGGYGSEPDEQAEEDAARAATEPRAVKVEVKELPLPDIQVKREVKKEPWEAPQELPVQQQREADGTEKDEEVDYEDGTTSESSSD